MDWEVECGLTWKAIRSVGVRTFGQQPHRCSSLREHQPPCCVSAAKLSSGVTLPPGKRLQIPKMCFCPQPHVVGQPRESHAILFLAFSNYYYLSCVLQLPLPKLWLQAFRILVFISCYPGDTLGCPPEEEAEVSKQLSSLYSLSSLTP